MDFPVLIFGGGSLDWEFVTAPDGTVYLIDLNNPSEVSVHDPHRGVSYRLRPGFVLRFRDATEKISPEPRGRQDT
jgi:hypothetical protein